MGHRLRMDQEILSIPCGSCLRIRRARFWRAVGSNAWPYQNSRISALGDGSFTNLSSRRATARTSDGDAA